MQAGRTAAVDAAAWCYASACACIRAFAFWPSAPQVLHVPDFDFRTSCILLSECLGEVKRWSGACLA